jgi:hypothetical protein
MMVLLWKIFLVAEWVMGVCGAAVLALEKAAQVLRVF